MAEARDVTNLQSYSLMAKYQMSAASLVDQVQILLRKEAGLESFNPNDLSHLPPLSSVLDEVIAGSNASVDALRCTDCRGELLRGPESVICVYCGRGQRQNECPPQPIAFNATFGFQWFLQSLGLDGSELVGAPFGGTQSDRGRSSLKDDEISLSDFLDVQLKWPDESMRFGVENEEQIPGKRLIGLDFDDVFTDGSGDHPSSVNNEQMLASEKIEISEITTVPGDRSLSLFESQSSEAALMSGEGENDESFFAWAQFQSSNPDAGHEKSANILISDAPSRNNLTSYWSDSKAGPIFDSKKSKGSILTEDGGRIFESLDASHDCPDQRRTTNEDPSDDEKRGSDDSIDEWEDFRVFTDAENNQHDPSSTTVPCTESSGGLGISDSWNDFTGSVGAENDQLQNIIFEVPDDAWNSFTTSSNTEDIKMQTRSFDQEKHPGIGHPFNGGENDFALLSGAYLEQKDTHAESIENKKSNQGDTIRLWNDDISFAFKDDQVSGTTPASLTTKEVHDSFDLWNDFKSSAVEHDSQQEAANRMVDDNKISTAGDSIVDVWNDFGGLGVQKKEQQASSSEAVGGKRNGSHDQSIALWNDDSLDAWGDFAGSSSIFDSKAVASDISSGGWDGFSSLLVTHVSQSQRSNTKAAEDGNSFSSWSDFNSLGTQAQNGSSDPYVTQSIPDQISFRKAPDNLAIVEDDNSFNSWGDFGGLTYNLEQQLQAAEAGPSENKLNGEVRDLFCGLNNTDNQSVSPPDNQHKSNGAIVRDGESTSENDDSFDSWTDFTSSSNVQANSWLSNSVAKGEEPDINLFSTNTNSQGVGPNSSLHPGLFLGMFSDQNGSAQVAFSPPEAPDLVRMEPGDVKADGYSHQINRSESASEETMDSNSSVETLISDMHDLSFMLDSSLSIPKSGR